MKKYNITVNGAMYEVFVEEADATGAAPVATPAPAAAAPAPKAAPKAAAPAGPKGAVKVTAPMPGNILKMNVKVGDTVPANGLVCILEAMKMENEIMAPCDGTVTVNVTKGAAVETGEVLCTIA